MSAKYDREEAFEWRCLCSTRDLCKAEGLNGGEKASETENSTVDVI